MEGSVLGIGTPGNSPHRPLQPVHLAWSPVHSGCPGQPRERDRLRENNRALGCISPDKTELNDPAVKVERVQEGLAGNYFVGEVPTVGFGLSQGARPGGG